MYGRDGPLIKMKIEALSLRRTRRLKTQDEDPLKPHAVMGHELTIRYVESN